MKRAAIVLSIAALGSRATRRATAGPARAATSRPFRRSPAGARRERERGRRRQAAAPEQLQRADRRRARLHGRAVPALLDERRLPQRSLAVNGVAGLAASRDRRQLRLARPPHPLAGLGAAGGGARRAGQGAFGLQLARAGAR